jgi:hypothetical protein
MPTSRPSAGAAHDLLHHFLLVGDELALGGQLAAARQRWQKIVVAAPRTAVASGCRASLLLRPDLAGAGDRQNDTSAIQLRIVSSSAPGCCGHLAVGAEHLDLAHRAHE